MEQAEFLAAQQQAEAQGAGYAVLTLAAITGTTSRTQGKMLVFEDGRTLGTIGGGPGEYAAVQDALALIGSGETKLLQYRHGYGAITVLIETFAAPPLLVLCGGGNVGRCLLQYAKLAGFRRWLLDPRPAEQIAESVALADRFIPVTRYETALERLNTPPDAFYVAASFSHETDLDAVRGILQKPFSYAGMLGSRKKVAAISALLLRQGIPPQQLARLHAPIGLDLGGQRPEELAVGILAEMIAVKNTGTGQPVRRDDAQ